MAVARQLRLKAGPPQVAQAASISVVLPVLEKVGVAVQPLQAAISAAIAKLPKVQGGGQPGMSAALQKVVERGFKEAENFKDEYCSTEHLLLALAGAKGNAVQGALTALGATHAAILKALSMVRGS